MDNKNLNRLIVVITLIIAILGLGVSLFAISSTIKISGYANFNNAKWDIHFENLSKVQLTGYAQEKSRPIINKNSTSINTFKVVFGSPSDTAAYEFNVVNSGDIDARITTISILNPHCIGTSEDVNTAYTDASKVCNNFKYELFYANGKRIMINDLLPAGSKKTLKLIMRYVGNEWPIENVELTDLSASIIYSQN